MYFSPAITPKDLLMTMISGYKLKDCGFLQADILLTSLHKGMRSSQVPSFQTYVDNQGLDTHVVVGLCQKILVVNDQFAVAFAGDVPDIQAVIRLIEKLIDQAPALTGKRFADAVLADSKLNQSKIEIIALSVEDDEVHISNIYAEFGHGNEHFEMWVGGSGAEHTIKHYKAYPPNEFDVSEEDIVVRGTCMALDQFAHNLIDEFDKKFQSETIKNSFGGGYEVLAFYDGKFRKISDVVYAFADAEFDVGGILQVDFPKCLIKSAYKGDDLKIRSVEFQYSEDEDEHVALNDRTFTIAPIARYQETTVVDNLNGLKFMGRFLCFLIKVKTNNGDFIVPAIRSYESDLHFLHEAFIASVNQDFVSISYSDIFREDIKAHVLGLMEQPNATI